MSARRRKSKLLRISRVRRRKVAERLALVVLALQAGLLLTLTLTPNDVPPRITLLELLWAAPRKAHFYPLVAVILAGPPLTVVAAREPGRHRWWLAITWPTFLLAMLLAFGPRLAVMLRVLWWQVS